MFQFGDSAKGTCNEITIEMRNVRNLQLTAKQTQAASNLRGQALKALEPKHPSFEKGSGPCLSHDSDHTIADRIVDGGHARVTLQRPVF